MEIKNLTSAAAPAAEKLSSAKSGPQPEKEIAIKDKVEISKRTKHGNALEGAKSWVKDNITGSPDKATSAKAALDPESDYVDKTALYAGIGAAAGGAVGTFTGMAVGLKEGDKVTKELVAKDINDPKLVGYTHSVTEDYHYEQRLTGYKDVLDGYDKNGNPMYRSEPQYEDVKVHDGWWHNFSPDIDNKKVGTYQVPEYKHSSWLHALTGGLAGLVSGSIIGGGIGMLVGLVQKAIHGNPGTEAKAAEVKAADKAAPAKAKAAQKPEAHKTSVLGGVKDKITHFVKENITGEDSGKSGKSGKAGSKDPDYVTIGAVSGAGVGAVSGGIIGYVAGKNEEARAVASHEKWLEPDLQKKNLGNIPSDYYQHDWFDWGWGYGHSDHVHFDDNNQIAGGDPVVRDAPVYNSDGSISMHSVEKDISSQRFGKTSGAILGGALGAAGGTLGGIAVGLMAKIAHEKAQH